jgi:hypothetical protein
MTCTTKDGAFETQMGDYVDGTLAGSALAPFEAHLSGCASCRALAADFRAIRTSALALESQVPPPQLWTRVSAAIQAQPRRSFMGGWFVSWQPIGAMAMALLVVTSLWWVSGRLAAEQLARLASAAAADTRVESPEDAYRVAEEGFTTAIASLEQVTKAESTTLDPDTAGVLQANLSVINEAIVETRAALKTEPENDLAQETLFEALRSKVALLQETLALINEMRKGNQEGAARIVSGLNQ